jgi:hypothetical protein
MRRLSVSVCLLALTLVAPVGPARAEDPAAEAEFAKRLFAGKLDKAKSYACFVRVYDRVHLARHPLQKVTAMKLLMTAEKDPDAAAPSYSFRMGVSFTKRPGNFDSSGECSAAMAAIAGAGKAQFGCGVDCDGGGISIEMTREDKATLVRLDRIRIWRNNKPEEEGLDMSGGADDRVFRLDRVKLDECKSLITDRKELAAIRTLPR